VPPLRSAPAYLALSSHNHRLLSTLQPCPAWRSGCSALSHSQRRCRLFPAAPLRRTEGERVRYRNRQGLVYRAEVSKGSVWGGVGNWGIGDSNAAHMWHTWPLLRIGFRGGSWKGRLTGVQYLLFPEGLQVSPKSGTHAPDETQVVGDAGEIHPHRPDVHA